MRPRDLKHVRALYDGEIRFTDRQIGRLVAALEARGLMARTVLSVVSDHGEEFFEHGGKGHRKTLYREVVRVPWIVRADGLVPAGGVVGGVAGHVDVAPTLLSLLGARPSPAMSGQDLAPALTGARDVAAGAAVARLDRSRTRQALVVETADTKALWTLEGESGTWTVFDLTRDPMETAPLDAEAAGPHIDAARRVLEQVRRMDREILRGLPESGRDGAIPEALERQLRELGYVK